MGPLLLMLNYLMNFSFAYYGDPKYGGMAVTPVFANALVSVGENIYSLEGQYVGKNGGIYVSENVIVFNFTSNQTLQEHTYEPSSREDPIGNYCQGFLLSDNKTIVVMGIEVDNGTETKISFDSFDTVDMKWRFTNTLLNASLFPSYRKYSSSVISPGNDALYLIGGTVVDDTYNIRVGIVQHPSLNLPLLGGSTDMLPNGVVVLAFGADSDLNLYSSSKVLLFSTNTNEIIIQPINGIAPNSRALTSSTLGPDQTTIYYFGGQDRTSLINTFGGTVYNDLVILDTNTWSWRLLEVTEMSPVPSTYSGMTVFNQNKIFISTGKLSISIETNNTSD
ncbi:hypothetical protein MFLAVUS_006239 [Mucor flavus]|uniref:Kelch repeat protein n=1 Tax=Mucor flavus TaxID=439312 RepID=A0ABP9Z118_9FUNG